MKITIEVDCTPEEARRAMGLPDLSPVHDRYVGMMVELVEKQGNAPEFVDSMMRSWGPMGEAGMNMWRGLFDAAAGGSKPSS